MATLLALDTSTERLVAALVTDEGTTGVDEEGGARASQRLVPAALELLAAAGLAPDALDAVAFGRGPGAFTGLRTAAAVAQGLAFGAGCPVLPVDSLQIVAEQARAEAGVDELWVVMDARMDEIYAGAYRWQGDDAGWQSLDAPALFTLPALQARWQSAPPACVAGSALAAFGERLDSGHARRLAPAAGRAAALARLAGQAWRRGQAVDAALALPVYLRDKVALTTAERAAAREEAAGAPGAASR